ncbi:hypothetical protein [Cellulomonas marina]|uniref:EVE domain-containing protein n=1 Tax=Cellulomonas marina TaxID=988821 RepID=A0A1I1AFV9_9CELL|nr:hypothetical protein [Cellulomonas marina]GIG30215.1 hypothetical protein Cma02nite_28150 [Cellulomonas marina]SFB36881.1 hypothetical protein SAMN05421867_11810 [Cellulomonas marina]
MRTFLLTYNPRRWQVPADEWDALRSGTGRGETVPGDWSTGQRRDVDPGDRLFLLRQGSEPRGIVAAGWATSVPERAVLFDGTGSTHYVDLEWEVVLDLDDPLPTEVLLREVPRVPWNGLRGSGVEVAPEELWLRHLNDGRTVR